jgi:hypothetical protein
VLELLRLILTDKTEKTLAIPYTYATGCKWVSEKVHSRQLGE